MDYKQTKEMFTKMREKEAIKFWKSSEYHELEKCYGKYLFVPLDIPKIQTNDQEAFIDFFKKNSKPIAKIKEDVAGVPINNQAKNYKPTFFSIDSINLQNGIWSKNYVPELFSSFKEIIDQIHEYFPIISGTHNFSLWSSQDVVVPHRDESCMIDIPINFRVKLFDNNPVETLQLHLSPVGKSEVPTRFILPDETNSWVWNNLRVKHSSVKLFNKEKILLIIYTNYHLDMNKFVDLLDRSISKFKDNLIIDTLNTSTDYINH